MLGSGWLLTGLLAAAVSLSRGSIRSQQVLKLVPRTRVQVDYVQRLKRAASHRIDFWQAPQKPGKPAVMRLSKRDATWVAHQARELSMEARLLHSSLHSVLKRDFHDHRLGRRELFQNGDRWDTFDLKRYHTFDEMMEYLRSLARAFPDLAKLVNYGKSYEGRDMLGLVIGGRNAMRPNGTRRRVFLDAGLHAREWAAPATALYTIHRLLTSDKPSDVDMRDEVEWHVLPNGNPDGYAYSMASPNNRYWRKTRSPQGCDAADGRACDCAAQPDLCCWGVDPNRNWDLAWGRAGASENPCSDIYMGNVSHSEPEVRNIATYLSKLSPQLDAYVSLHSFSDLWLVPYGWGVDAYPEDFDDLIQLARDSVAAINKVHGSNYTAEHSAGLYPAAGASDDWVKGRLGVKWVYTVELRPNESDPSANEDDGYGGFALPAEQILPTGEEVFEGLRVLVTRVRSDE